MGFKKFDEQDLAFIKSVIDAEDRVCTAMISLKNIVTMNWVVPAGIPMS